MRRVGRIGGRLCSFVIFTIMLIPICGCSHLDGGFRAKSAFEEANGYFNRGSYQASLNKYEQILEEYPAIGDRVLFEMGIIYAHPNNERKDCQQSLECFQKLVRDYPGSDYRQDSEMMIFYIANVIFKDKVIASQQKEIEALLQEVKSRGREIFALQQEVEKNEDEITTLQQEIAVLERKISASAVQKGPADKVLIEKKARRLTLISKGEVLKSYEIALGGNPNGPKERQGDNKTPEGTYFIDSRNRDSHYHLSLHISYPNERDKKRAKELGVSPGRDIMIHGIKKGFSWVGEFHTEIDWTKGCVAVTDEEIEEIDKLVPNGTIVEIRP